MKITAVIKKTFDTGKVRAIADVTLDGAFAIHGHPSTADARSELYHAVHDAYKAEMAQTEEEELPFGMSM